MARNVIYGNNNGIDFVEFIATILDWSILKSNRMAQSSLEGQQTRSH